MVRVSMSKGIISFFDSLLTPARGAKSVMDPCIHSSITTSNKDTMLLTSSQVARKRVVVPRDVGDLAIEGNGVGRSRIGHGGAESKLVGAIMQGLCGGLQFGNGGLLLFDGALVLLNLRSNVFLVRQLAEVSRVLGLRFRPRT